MLVVALTGGIGSGKSTVANMFEQHGVPIIDADVIARELSQPDQPAYFTIIQHFGPEIIMKDGRINRKRLRHIIFTQPEERLWLEDLLHPLILDDIAKQIKRTQAAYCLVVIPLLLESEYSFPFINRILVVDTPEHLQISRAAQRDEALHHEVEAIANAQLGRQERLAKAHDVVINDGKIEDLKPQVEKMHNFYLSLAT